MPNSILISTIKHTFHLSISSQNMANKRLASKRYGKANPKKANTHALPGLIYTER